MVFVIYGETVRRIGGLSFPLKTLAFCAEKDKEKIFYIARAEKKRAIFEKQIPDSPLLSGVVFFIIQIISVF